MSRKRSKPPTTRKRTKPTLLRTHLALVTGVQNQLGGPSVHHEIELVKAGLLYADSIEILSLGSKIVRELAEFGDNDPSAMWSLITSLDDETLIRMGASSVAENRNVLRQLLSLDPDLIRSLARADPEMAQLEDFAGFLDEQRTHAAASMGEFRRITEDLRAASGVGELESVLDGKLVRFNENVAVDGDSEAIIDSFLAELKRYLRNPNVFVLLDEEMASMARSLINEGLVQIPERSLSNAAEAVLGTGLLARLPAFPSLALSEALDLRKDLNEPLDKYRRRVAQLRGELQTTPFDAHVQAEVNAVWRTEIVPAITDIRKAMADHCLVREVAKSLGRNASDVANGWAPAGVAVVSGAHFQVEGLITAGVAAAVAVAPAVIRGIMDSLEGKAVARAHDLYYLYEVERRTSSVGAASEPTARPVSVHRW